MIRAAVPADYDEIAGMLADFHAAAGTQYTRFDKPSAIQTIAYLATLPAGAVLVAKAGMADRAGVNIIGVIGGIIVPVFVDFAQLQAHEAFWWVRPEARRTGAGIALIAALEQWAIAGGAKTLTMVSFHGSGHEAVGDLYRRRGYAPFEYHYIKDLACSIPSS